MESNAIALLGLAALFLMIFLRVPISFAMFITGILGLYFVSTSEAAFFMAVSDVWSTFSSYNHMVIPLFILMGEIIFISGVTGKLFESAYRWFGHLRGGMACTTILASAGFASICGSNAAATASMGRVALPELEKYRYNNALSTGAVATGGTLGAIIPPSTVLIVLAIQTQQSIRDLFVASFIPGFLLTFFFILTIIYLCQRNPEFGPAGPKFTWKEKIKSIYGVIPILALFVFVIGGLFLGFFTPTESGAFGAFGSIVLALVMRKLTIKKFVSAASETLRTSTMVVMLIVGATFFGRFLTYTGLPNDVAQLVTTLAVPSIVILFVILMIYVVGGALMDSMGFLLVSIPIFFPPIVAMGYDPIWFSIVLCIITSLGAITPPVGVNTFVVKGLTPNIPITTIYRGTSYFIVSYVLFVALLIAFPQIVLFLVN